MNLYQALGDGGSLGNSVVNFFNTSYTLNDAGYALGNNDFDFFTSVYAKGQEQAYIDGLSKAANDYDQRARLTGIIDATGYYLVSQTQIDGNGNYVIEQVNFTGYMPTVTAKYSLDQAVALYNAMNPALANDQANTNLILKANYYFTGGEFRPGAVTATVAILKAAIAQWAQDKLHQDRNSAIFGDIVLAALAAVTGLAALEVYGAAGAAAGAAVSSDVTSNFVFNAALDSQSANVALNLTPDLGVTAMDFTDLTSNDFVYNAAADSQAANIDLGLQATDYGVNYGSASIPDFTGQSIASSGSGSGWTVAGVASDLTIAAKTALTLLPVYKMLTGQSMTSTSFINPAGATVTPMPNGTLVTRSTNGQYTTTAMPVGQVYTFPDGSSVVNNGNGTYTTISASGVSQTLPLPTTSALGNLSPTMIGVLALGAFMLLKK